MTARFARFDAADDTTSVRRFDRGELRKPVRLDNGYLKVDAFLTRAGVFTYRKADGKEIREYRPPEEVFAPASVASFDLMPVTNDHPPVGLLTPANTHQFQCGTVGSPAREELRMRGAIMVTDAKAIADLEKGKNQVSLGYVCDLEFTPGVSPEGERYDAIQRNIRGNHAALVSIGRAGPEIAVRMDSGDAAMIASESSKLPLPPSETPQMKRKIKLDDGTVLEVDEAVAVIFEQSQAKHDAALKAKTAEVDGQRARADTAEKRAADLEKALAEAPAKALAAATARANLEMKAKEILGSTATFDGKDDQAIKREVIAKLAGSEVAKDASPVYVDARFDAEVAISARSNPGLAAARAASTPAARADSAGGSTLLAEKMKEYNAAVAKSHVSP